VPTIVDGGSLLSCDPPAGMEIAGGTSTFDALVAAMLVLATVSYCPTTDT
jgi:hypothetical protein